MSWQDDLRQLDQALAQGQVSADEYRKRRDQLLATASSGGAPQPVQPAEQAPVVPQEPNTPPPGQPVQPPTPPPGLELPQQAPQQQTPQQPPAGGPFAPPFRWDTPDATQVVATGNDNNDNPERTQVVSQQPSQFGQHTPESDRTQTLRPVAGPQSHPVPPWQAQQPQPSNPTPPWGADDGPISMPNPTWLAQGPELFDAPAKKKGKGVWIALVVVVVLGLGVGAFFLFGNKGATEAGPEQTGQTQAPPPVTTTTVKPKDDLEVAKLDGNAEDVSNITTFADAEKKGFMEAPEYDIYKNGDPGKTRMTIVTLPNGVKAYIFTAQMATAQNAVTTANALAEQQVKFGLKVYGDVPQGQGLLAHNLEKTGAPALFRVHYVHKTTVARIQVTGADADQVVSAFKTVLDDQLEALAPTP
jgi:hypothetical protein